MTKVRRTPWNPDPRLVDPFIAILSLLCLLLGGMLVANRAAQAHPEPRAGVQGRLAELLPRLPARPSEAQRPATWTWDDGIRAVLAAERGDKAPSGSQAPADPLFAKAFQAAYGGYDGIPDPRERRDLRVALGEGYAARLLEARLLERQGKDPGPLREEARAWRAWRGGLLAVLGGAGILMGLAAIVLAAVWVRLPRVPAFPLPGQSLRVTLVVFLVWFLAFLLSGTVAGLVTGLLPAFKPAALAIAYAFHAGTGVLMVSMASGRGVAEIVQDMFSGFEPALALQGLGYLCLAVGLVFTVSLLLGPLMPSGDLPQRELVQVLTRAGSPWALAASLGTLVLLAPAFEEILFRGFLLPALSGRIGTTWALLLSAAVFAGIHLQPRGIPTLLCLGLVLGLSVVRTGRLAPAIQVHALWNGGVFVLMWILAG